jgi:hypothetical protein
MVRAAQSSREFFPFMNTFVDNLYIFFAKRGPEE